MSEDETVECKYCGESFHKQGIGAHEASCEGVNRAENPHEPEFYNLEADVYARDDEQCARCGADDVFDIHQIDPSVGAERANLVSLCEECVDDVSDLHPITKRTKIYQ